jgi:formiminotetrahydrofolate cyclodeaminase
MTQHDAYLDARTADLLESIAARTSAPGGGSVAALAGAMAAGLVAMGARFADESWADSGAAAAQAEALRDRLAPLAHADALAYEQALAAMRSPQATGQEQRDFEIRQALELAAAIPQAIAEAAADVAALGALVAEHGNPRVRPDTLTGVLLAAAAARAAAVLVEVNLATLPGDARAEASQRAAAAAEADARRVLRGD